MGPTDAPWAWPVQPLGVFPPGVAPAAGQPVGAAAAAARGRAGLSGRGAAAAGERAEADATHTTDVGATKAQATKAAARRGVMAVPLPGATTASATAAGAGPVLAALCPRPVTRLSRLGGSSGLAWAAVVLVALQLVLVALLVARSARCPGVAGEQIDGPRV